MKPSKSQDPIAARIDALLVQVSKHFRALPRADKARSFREALAHYRLPGGYATRGAVARPLAQCINSNLKGI